MSTFLLALQLLFAFRSRLIWSEEASRADCNSDSGWECDYSPDFSQRDGDHHFCALHVIQLDPEARGKLNEHSDTPHPHLIYTC